jgi:Uma2 family endonuclease
MAHAVLRREDGQNRLAITVGMLQAMVASGTIEDPSRVELIEGELVYLSSVSRNQARIKANLIMQLSDQISPAFDVLGRVSVRLDAHNEPMPDICVARAGVTTDVLNPSDCVLVIEVSESTVRQDRNVKANLYAQAGLPEYWVVDLNTSGTTVHRGPSEAGWSDVVSVPFDGELVAAFDGAVRVVVG